NSFRCSQSDGHSLRSQNLTEHGTSPVCGGGTLLAKSGSSPGLDRLPRSLLRAFQQVQLLGRRSHPRCVVPASVEGVMSISHDVMGGSRGGKDVRVISREWGARGEGCGLPLAEPNIANLSVRVLDSRPAVIEGSIRHVLKLRLEVEEGVPDAS